MPVHAALVPTRRDWPEVNTAQDQQATLRGGSGGGELGAERILHHALHHRHAAAAVGSNPEPIYAGPSLIT